MKLPIKNIFILDLPSFPGTKSNFVPKGIPIGFEMAENKVNRQINK